MNTTLHIDYLTISTPSFAGAPYEGESMDIHDYYTRAAYHTLRDYPTFCRESMKGEKTVLGGGSGFKHRTFHKHGGWTVFYGSSHGRIAIFLPGEACHRLRSEVGKDGAPVGLGGLLTSPYNRMTRIDIAGNWQTNAGVDVIAACFRKKDMSKYPRVPSETGISQYIGGDKSDKRAIVYEYFKPHPRHGWTRIEFKLFKEVAQKAQKNIITEGLLPVYLRLLKDWRFDNPIMLNALGVGVEGSPIAYQKRQKAGSLAWLYGTCLTALRNGIAEGKITWPDIVAGVLGDDWLKD